MVIHVENIDHLVLTVASIDITVDFYTRVLGMEACEFGAGRTALMFGTQKINLHQRGKEFEPKAANVATGSADLCFIIKQPLAQAMAHLQACHITILDGPVERTGAQGPMISAYFRDPDGNLIEISNYQDA